MKLPESLRREQFIIEPATDTTACKKMEEEITKCWNISLENFM